MAGKDKLMAQAAEHLDGEIALASAEGSYETRMLGNDHVRKGVLIATDRRLVFFAKKLGGFQLESFPYANISSFEQGKNMMGGTVSFYASGNRVSVKWIAAKEDLRTLVDVVNRYTSQPVESGAVAPSNAGLTPKSDPMEQLTKLAELRERGLLTEDEFQAKRLVLVGQL